MTSTLKKYLAVLCLVVLVFVGIWLLILVQNSEQRYSMTHKTDSIYKGSGNDIEVGQTMIDVGVLTASKWLLPKSEQELIKVSKNPGTTNISSNIEVDQVQDNIEACLHESKLATQYPQLTAIAKNNSVLFLREYRKVIPRASLEGYSNHCWNEEYSLRVPFRSNSVEGHIGNQTFNQKLPRFWFGKAMLNDLKTKFHSSFRSSKVCLPNTYLLGFGKCGSTFFWCFLSKLVHSFYMGANDPLNFQAYKEPYFWTPLTYELAPPRASQIGNPYLVNYLSAFNPTMNVDKQKKVVLIDGCPNNVIEWPRFKKEDPSLANYCLLPSTLPELFPRSKYVVIVRNPVEMMYSSFWWSLVYVSNQTRRSAVSKKYQGPNIFHERAMAKIERFLDCMSVDSNLFLHPRCNIANMTLTQYSACVSQRVEMLGKCVYNITNRRRLYETVLHRGIYYAHLIRWMSVLPRNRLLVVVMEELLQDPVSVAQDVLNFFGMTEYSLTKEKVNNIMSSCQRRKNSNNMVNYSHDLRLKMRPDTEKLLKKFFFPFNRMLSDILSAPQIMKLWS